MSKPSLHSTKRVDYAALNEGDDAETEEIFHDSFSESPHEVSVDDLTRQIEAARIEQDRLSKENELSKLREELDSIKAENQRLQAPKSKSAMLTSSSPAVASRSDRPADVRSDQRIASLVDKALAQFGLSESSSSDDESEFGEGKKKRRSRQIAKVSCVRGSCLK